MRLGVKWPVVFSTIMGCVSGVALTACSGNEFPTAIQTAIKAAVETNLAAYGAQSSVPGALVGIWAPKKGTYVKGFGYSNLTTRVAMNTANYFRVGSNTKTFVTTVLLQLVDEGKISLDDPVSKFDVGVTIPNGDNITIRELCNMTSGLFEAYHTSEFAAHPIDQAITPQQMVTWAVAYPPVFEPGSSWNYSNTNYLLLGMILESITGNPIQDEIRDRLLVPFGLDHTIFPTTDLGMPEPYAHGYMADDDESWEDATVLFHPSISWTAGVMISDMEDMKTWVKTYVTGVTNSTASQEERLTCVATDASYHRFGLAVECSGGWYGYTGSIAGYNTAVYYLTDEDATVIVFATTQKETPAPGVANAIFRDITKVVFPSNVAFAE